MKRLKQLAAHMPKSIALARTDDASSQTWLAEQQRFIGAWPHMEERLAAEVSDAVGAPGARQLFACLEDVTGDCSEQMECAEWPISNR